MIGLRHSAVGFALSIALGASVSCSAPAREGGGAGAEDTSAPVDVAEDTARDTAHAGTEGDAEVSDSEPTDATDGGDVPVVDDIADDPRDSDDVRVPDGEVPTDDVEAEGPNLDVSDGDVPDVHDANPDECPVAVPTSWEPTSGEEWAAGACIGHVVPPPDVSVLGGDGAVRVVVDAAPDGTCACAPGMCVELEPYPEARTERVTLTLEVSGRFPVGVAASSPSYGFAAWGDLADETWTVFGPDARVRVAVRPFPSATQDETIATFGLISWPFFTALDEPPYPEGLMPVTTGGLVRPGLFASEFRIERREPGHGGVDCAWGPRRYLAIGTEVAPFCGNGVVDEHEICDPALDTGIYGCSLTCRPDDTGYECGAEGCPSICDSLECEDPGPCARSECVRAARACVVEPMSEGEACEVDGLHGWCDNGACNTDPTECAPCGPSARWYDGACRPTEREATYFVRPGLGGRDAGAWHSFALATYLFEVPDGFSFERGEFAIQYRSAPYEADWVPSPGFFDYSVFDQPRSEDWRIGRIGFPHASSDDFPRSVWFGINPALLFYFPVVGGETYIRRARISEAGLDLCSIGVAHDGGWASCPTRVGDEWCGDACVNTRINDQHCGDCGVSCGENEVCERGQCVPLPILRQLAPGHMEGCDPGYWGHDCAAACPGLEESGVSCWGRGECHDGLWGNGVCYCRWYERHGIHCEFSCSDGIRNGLEFNIDCGGGVCAPCE